MIRLFSFILILSISHSAFQLSLYILGTYSNGFLDSQKYFTSTHVLYFIDQKFTAFAFVYSYVAS